MTLAQRFKASSRDAKPRNIQLVAFDTEFDTGDGSFLCGAYYGEIYDNNGRKQVISEYCDTVEEFCAVLTSIEKRLGKRNRITLIGYNTAVDMVYLGDLVDTSTILEAGSKFLTAKTHGGTTIIDCTNHVTGTLQSWMERLKMDETHGIIKREGYLDSDEGKRAQVLDDARATWILGCWIRDLYAETWGVTLPITKFSAALKIFQKQYFNDAWYRTDREGWKNNYEREAYYGGRVEIFLRGTYEVHSYDVNSMYVAIMRDSQIPNPTISRWLTDPDEIRARFDAGDILTMDVTVRCPHRKVGLLPYRDVKNNKLIFPSGRWRGKYNSVELRTACEFGCVIEEIHTALWYPETQPYFSAYAQMTLDGRARCRAAGDAATEQFYKYLGNGLYGKFAQRNASGGEYIKIEDYEGTLEGATIRWNDDGEIGYVMVPRGEYEDSMHTFPVVSATITAYGRSLLLRALIANEGNVVYCDTDSIKLLRPATGIDIGALPGQFGYEYTREEEFMACKCYGSKRKGVPKTARRVCPLFDGRGAWVGGATSDVAEYWLYEKWIKRRTAIRHDKVVNTVHESLKVLKNVDNKRDWSGDTSMPLSLPQYINGCI